MSFNAVAIYVFVICAVTFASGMPQNIDATSKEKSLSLPFLQFTDKGIRVNFAGYHAEAGLGGLLRGLGTGGGLHASVGTPWGAHAGAGLGGTVSGQDGAIGGGLYARAGLGHGRPEAAAGLGGRLDGSGYSLNPISGGLYAGATPGGGPGPGVYLGNGGGIEYAGSNDVPAEAPDANPQADNKQSTKETDVTVVGAGEAKPATRGHTNIQIIPTKLNKEKEKVVLATAALQTDAPATKKTELKSNEVRRAVPYVVVPPAAQLDVVGSFSTAAVVPAVTVVKTVETNVVPAPPVPVVVQDVAKVNTNTKVVATVDDNISTIPKVTYPRWYFRKRFWSAPRKTVYVAPTAVEATDSQSASSSVNGGFVAAGNGGVVVATKTYGGSLFDDIFNIPISTLGAVNQLLNNLG